MPGPFGWFSLIVLFLAIIIVHLSLWGDSDSQEQKGPDDSPLQAVVEQQPLPLLDWVRANGGYFNEKQELRYESDESSLFGVFATKDIEEGEVLLSMPWKVVLSPRTSSKRFENCDTVKYIQEELDKKSDSFHALHIEDLKQTASRHASLLPAYWPPKAQALLKKVIGDGGLPPSDPFLENFEWKQRCEQHSEIGTLLVFTHSEDFGFVPIADKYNNRGSPWENAYFSVEASDEVALEMRASRDISAGEQLYTDYRDYGRIGTPELLRDYGFVEMYPQRWIFHEQGTAFDLHQLEDGSLQVDWQEGADSEEAFDFLQKELTRLKQEVYPELQQCLQEGSQKVASCRDVPRDNLEVTVRFAKDMMVAIEHALEDMEKE